MPQTVVQYTLSDELPREIFRGWIIKEIGGDGKTYKIEHSDGRIVQVPSNMVKATGYTYSAPTPAPRNISAEGGYDN